MSWEILNIKSNFDSRGCLSSVEGGQDIPFEIKRIFYMHHVTEDRGGHAHIDTDQLIIPISGFFKVKLFDGKHTEIFDMHDCTKGLYVPRLVFTDLYDFTQDAVCLVLSSTHYDMSKSLRSMDAYMCFLKNIKD